ncbi:hypothetical protein J2S74_002115 [Evansella vedderi]|uniref:Uncharacterized protein n=1 Tax=Evansella vedderi TaxID=38282 RepID=A0ABT9ZU10_9BACI|nr:hypothetical protein [Evansella vedderi]MDQ0254736.1 hypothetical protein [Evansella vedderi]
MLTSYINGAIDNPIKSLRKRVKRWNKPINAAYSLAENNPVPAEWI